MSRVKRFVVGSLLNLSRKLGVSIQKMQYLDHEITKLHTIKNPRSKLNAVKELVRKYPRHPLPHLELAQCLHKLSDPNEFEQFNRYGEVRQEWLIQTGLEELNLEFIWPGMFIGSLGNHYAIESLLKANKLRLRPAKKPFLLLPHNMQFRNPALFEYFEPHLCIIRDAEVIKSLKRLESILTLPLGIVLPLNDGCPFLDFAANRAEMEEEKQGFELDLFQLSVRHKEMGIQVLEKLGVPKDAWYVTLHVREPGYRGETRANTTEKWRNANPLDYIKAIKAVTKAGGWVFRMGDPSMTPLPSMPQVIDYARHEIRSDWMDVFLGATCRFLIGTGSGYFHIPAFFGVPCILTNFPGFAPYYGLRSHDLYLPRWQKNIQTNDLVSFEQYMSPPESMLSSMNSFRDAGLHWVENTPEELEVVTKEMLKSIAGSGQSSTITDNDLQRHFKTLTETCGEKYGKHLVKAFAPISQEFLERHADLLEC